MFNLIIFTLLTTMAYEFQKNFSSRQLIVDNIKVITEFRTIKLSELDNCVNELNNIARIKFSVKDDNLEICAACQMLRRSINLFLQSSHEIFSDYYLINNISKEQVAKIINNKVDCIINSIKEIDNKDEYQNMLYSINQKVVSLRNNLWNFTYCELKKYKE